MSLLLKFCNFVFTVHHGSISISPTRRLEEWHKVSHRIGKGLEQFSGDFKLIYTVQNTYKSLDII